MYPSIPAIPVTRESPAKTRHCAICGNPAFISFWGLELCGKHFASLFTVFIVTPTLMILVTIQQIQLIGQVYEMMVKMKFSQGDIALFFGATALVTVIAIYLLSKFQGRVK